MVTVISLVLFPVVTTKPGGSVQLYWFVFSISGTEYTIFVTPLQTLVAPLMDCASSGRG